MEFIGFMGFRVYRLYRVYSVYRGIGFIGLRVRVTTALENLITPHPTCKRSSLPRDSFSALAQMSLKTP